MYKELRVVPGRVILLLDIIITYGENRDGIMLKCSCETCSEKSKVPFSYLLLNEALRNV